MSFFTRLSNGWKLSMSSFRVLKENQQLIIFPILSGIALLVVVASFVVAAFASASWDIDNLSEGSTITNYLFLFIFYLVNYFVIVFFNMALIHCTRLYFRGETPTVRQGLEFSLSRIGVIFSWAVFAATIGSILRIIQEEAGLIGRIITGLIGVVWSIATFFVVPVIAYEDAGPITAFKRSSQIMKEKWGESLGATFSFGLVQFIAILIVVLPLFFLGSIIHPFVGIALAIAGAFIIMAIISAAETIFISAVYHNLHEEPIKDFDKNILDDLFERKAKSGLL